MKKIKKEIWLLIILGIIIVVLIGFLMIPKKSVQQNNQQQLNVNPADGIQINSPQEGTEISSPVKITGVVKGDGWAGFEGQVGKVYLFDADNKFLAQGVLTAISEWTTLPTNFEANIEFNAGSSKTGNLVFQNENPSGLKENDKAFMLPVKFK